MYLSLSLSLSVYIPIHLSLSFLLALAERIHHAEGVGRPRITEEEHAVRLLAIRRRLPMRRPPPSAGACVGLQLPQAIVPLLQRLDGARRRLQRERRVLRRLRADVLEPTGGKINEVSMYLCICI